MIDRLRWLTVAVAYAFTHAAHARGQLADHLDTIALDRADDYFRGLADGLRLATFFTAPKAQVWN